MNPPTEDEFDKWYTENYDSITAYFNKTKDFNRFKDEEHYRYLRSSRRNDGDYYAIGRPMCGPVNWVKYHDGKYYWVTTVEDYEYTQEITERLYYELLLYEKSLMKDVIDNYHQ